MPDGSDVPRSAWSPRTAADYAVSLAMRLPVGAVWPRDPASVLMREVAGLSEVVGKWAERVARFLLIEAFPPQSEWLLPDWERVLGLPEPCFPVAQTIAERRLQVLEKLRRRPGGQSRQYMLGLAQRLGYGTEASPIVITEYRPAQCAMTPCGGWVKREGQLEIRTGGVGTPAIRFLWTIKVPEPRFTWFAVGGNGGRAGQDPHLRIQRAVDLECILQKLKPAHTNLIFDYTGL